MLMTEIGEFPKNQSCVMKTMKECCLQTLFLNEIFLLTQVNQYIGKVARTPRPILQK